MPTALERAQEQEVRKLRQQGFNPDGTRIAGAGAGSSDDDDDDGNGNDIGDTGNDDDAGGDDDAGNNGGDNPTGLLLDRIRQLEADLSAANNRAAPEQQRAQEMRDLWQASERERQRIEQEAAARIEALEAQLNAAQPAFNVDSVLTDEDRERFDPETLKVITKIAEGIAKAHTPKVDVRGETLRTLQEQEQNRVNEYRKKVLTDPTRGLHQLAQLSRDPAFQAWAADEDNDMESVVTSLLNAKSTEEIDRFAKIVAKRINRFKERNNKPTDARTSLANGMRREGKPRLTEAEVNAKLKEATRLSRSRNPADRQKAQQILNELK